VVVVVRLGVAVVALVAMKMISCRFAMTMISSSLVMTMI